MSSFAYTFLNTKHLFDIIQVIRKGTDGPKKNPAPWYDVAMTTNTSIVVSHYYVPVEYGDFNVTFFTNF